MKNVLEFPSKTFVQWEAVAQEIVPYLAQCGASREEICAVIERVRFRWEQLEPASPGHGAGAAAVDAHDTVPASGELEEHGIYVSRHWRSQPARTLIESAGADYRRHPRG
ncbi:hypothetical protein [Massilia sp. BKSP1R2A-1]|jgi:hypothetical protein|uniref:hypothetical protein n=1 Tax=Massilia sp. BKSP1R2A-1 TaxID=3422595 RepID=UPI003D32B363